MIPTGMKMVRLIRRAFADDCYDSKVSDVYNYDYCVVDFEESIRWKEGK